MCHSEMATIFMCLAGHAADPMHRQYVVPLPDNEKARQELAPGRIAAGRLGQERQQHGKIRSDGARVSHPLVVPAMPEAWQKVKCSN